MPATKVCRAIGVSDQTYYRWKKRYGCLGISEIRRSSSSRRRTASSSTWWRISARQADAAECAAKKLSKPERRRELVGTWSDGMDPADHSNLDQFSSAISTADGSRADFPTFPFGKRARWRTREIN